MTVKTPFIAYGGLYNVITLLFLGAVARFLINLYKARLKMIRLKEQGLVGTPSFHGAEQSGSPEN
jgi:hypothetical protein